MNARKIIGKLLAAFLLVSIGVAIGKEMTLRQAAPSAEFAVSGETKVVVYYMHGIPCVTCTFIETTARNLVLDEFAGAVEAGRMEFVSVDYLEPANALLADQYDVGSNMVIAVRLEGGRETARVRLDEVMELAADEDRLRQYLREGIRTALEGEGR